MQIIGLDMLRGYGQFMDDLSEVAAQFKMKSTLSSPHRLIHLSCPSKSLIPAVFYWLLITIIVPREKNPDLLYRRIEHM